MIQHSRRFPICLKRHSAPDPHRNRDPRRSSQGPRGLARLHLALPGGQARALLGIAVAVLSTAAVLALRLSLEQLLSGNAPLLAFVLAVSVTAIVAGFWPGVLATTLGALAGTHFFTERAWGLQTGAEIVRLVMFGLVGLLISSLSASLHRALAQSRKDHEALTQSEAALRQSRDELERRVARRTAELERQIRERETVEAELRQAKEELRRRAEQALREGEARFRTNLVQLEAIVSSMTEGLMVFDADAKIVTLNPSAVTILGFESEDELRTLSALGDDLLEVADLSGQPVPLEQWPISRVIAGETFSAIEVRVRRKDNGLSWILSYGGRPVRDESGKIVLAVTTFRDVTAQRKAEEEREMLLESERAARAEAERASRVKDEFVATLSHELRTPLTAILGWAQILRKPGNVTPERLEKGLETIERNTRLQAQLVSDLLDMSRIITGKVRLDVQPADLASVLDASLESVRHAAEAKHIRIRKSSGEIGGPVMVDPARIQQVVWNLLSNAIKFTPAGGEVQVSLARTASQVTITVEDTGQGISAEFLPQLFGRFRQADSSATRKYGGLGLGLAIVKHLVELHGGRVRAESEGAGKGARFVVELPLVPALPEEDALEASWYAHEARPRPASACAAHELAGVKVLVVEDEPDTRELVKRLLEECHAEVVTAESAPEALGLLGREMPDVLVSDIGMPGMDGYALIRQIRAAQGVGAAELPAVALTAFARPEDRQRALSAGYEAHLAKPVEPSALVATVAGLSSLREKQRMEGLSRLK